MYWSPASFESRPKADHKLIHRTTSQHLGEGIFECVDVLSSVSARGMTSLMRSRGRLDDDRSGQVISYHRRSLHDRPDEEDMNLDDSNIGFVRSASSGFCLLRGELSRVPTGLDRECGCSCPSGDSLLLPSWASLLPLAVPVPALAEASSGSRSSLASLACRSER